jgi:HAE1 family hydrophobic/amphiphilic exporter-1
MLVSLYSPKGTYDEIFLTNYAFINLMDPLTRVPGVGRVDLRGQYALRCWIKPDQLARLGVTVAEIVNAIGAQNSVNPAGQIGGEPAPQVRSLLYRAVARPPRDTGGIWRDHRARQSRRLGAAAADVARISWRRRPTV